MVGDRDDEIEDQICSCRDGSRGREDNTETCGKLVRLTRLMITRNCKELTNIVPQYAINANAQLALHVSPSRCFPVVSAGLR